MSSLNPCAVELLSETGKCLAKRSYTCEMKWFGATLDWSFPLKFLPRSCRSDISSAWVVSAFSSREDLVLEKLALRPIASFCTRNDSRSPLRSRLQIAPAVTFTSRLALAPDGDVAGDQCELKNLEVPKWDKRRCNIVGEPQHRSP